MSEIVECCADCGKEGDWSDWCHYCGEPLCDDCAKPSGYAICCACEEEE